MSFKITGYQIQLHDIEENWVNKLSEFVPEAAQIIVYDPDSNYSYPRFKIGDGRTPALDLPFYGELSYKKVQEVLEKNNSEKNKFIDTIAQDDQGKVSVTFREVDLNEDFKKKQENISYSGNNTQTISSITQNEDGIISVSYSDIEFPKIPTLQILNDDNGPEIPSSNSVIVYKNIISDGKDLTPETVEVATEFGVSAKIDELKNSDIKNIEIELNNINNDESGILANAKAYTDDQNIFETDLLTLKPIGGIDIGSDLNGLTTHEILKKLLYPYLDASVGNAISNIDGNIYENGITKTIDQVKIIIEKKSEKIESVALYNGANLLLEKFGEAVANGGTIIFNKMLEGEEEIQLNVEVPTEGNQLTVKVNYPDAYGRIKTVERKTSKIDFVYPYYWGVCSSTDIIDEDLIKKFSKKIEAKGNKLNIPFTCSNQRVVFAYPKAYGLLNTIVDPNNFEIINDFEIKEIGITGLDMSTQSYYVYISSASTISDFQIDFKY